MLKHEERRSEPLVERAQHATVQEGDHEAFTTPLATKTGLASQIAAPARFLFAGEEKEEEEEEEGSWQVRD